jgi:uncharacterized protein with FMN-binding domain
MRPYVGILALCLALGSCKSTLDNIDKLVISDIHPSTVKDGVYEGSQWNWPDTAKVRVTVKDGAIVSILILSHGHGPAHGAEAIPGRVVAAQSLQVDSVSGATYTSKVMLKAIEKALEKGTVSQ